MELRNWMKDIDGSRALLSLDIPATHNSAAVEVQNAYLSRCQNKGLYEQLNIGVRLFDIRVDIKNNEMILVHGAAVIFISGKEPMKFSDAVEICKRFLNENPSETVIIQFKNDNNKRQTECFDRLMKIIDGDRDLWCVKDTVPTLDEARGKLVLIRRCLGEKGVGIDFSNWKEQDAKIGEGVVLKTEKESFLIQDRYKLSATNKWKLAVKPLLDRGSENGEFILNYLSTAGGLKNPGQSAKYINEKFSEYVLDKEKYYGAVFLDFADERLTQKIIENNFK